MANKTYEEVLDFDFGFTFIDEELQEKELAAEETIQQVSSEKQSLEDQLVDAKLTADDLEYRLGLLYNSVVPFLNNLCKNPDKSTIYWPDRVSKIESYRDKLLSIVEGK